MVRRVLSTGISVLLIGAFALLVQSKTADAYIDFGTGSYLLQMLLATLLASVFMLKIFWHRLTVQVARFLAKFKEPDA